MNLGRRGVNSVWSRDMFEARRCREPLMDAARRGVYNHEPAAGPKASGGHGSPEPRRAEGARHALFAGEKLLPTRPAAQTARNARARTQTSATARRRVHPRMPSTDRKSTRLNSSHVALSRT